MPLDPVQVEDTLKWLRKAKDDLRVAQALIDVEPPLFDEIAFHCQQSIEKAEKGFLFWHKQPFQKTHDLYLLGLKIIFNLTKAKLLYMLPLNQLETTAPKIFPI